MKSANTNLKLSSIEFLVHYLATAPSAAVELVEKLGPLIINASTDHFYKISAEAFLALGLIIKLIHPHTTVHIDFEISDSRKDKVGRVFTCTMDTLEGTEADLEVKQQALTALGLVMAHTGHLLPPNDQASRIPATLLKCLRNESLRSTAINTINLIADSQIMADCQDKFDFRVYIPELANLIPKALSRVETLTCIEALLRNTNAQVDQNVCSSILNDIINIVDSSETDVHSLSKAFSLAGVILQLASAVNAAQTLTIFSKSFTPSLVKIIVESPHLVAGGTGLESLLRLWSHMTRFHEKSLVFESGIAGLMASVSSQTCGKESFAIIAKCMGQVSQSPLETNVLPLVNTFLQHVTDLNSQDMTVVSLLSLGEIGRHMYNRLTKQHGAILSVS
jgi:hypothetical protein